MSIVDTAKIEFWLQELKTSRAKAEYQMAVLSQPQVVTRALEPTYTSSKNRDQLLLEISVLQRDLNRQKNLLTKISKALRSLPS